MRKEQPGFLYIIGGSSHHPGGVESFCRRATEAFLRHGGRWRVAAVETNTAFFTRHRVKGTLAAMWKVARFPRRADTLLWLQVANFPDLLFLLVAKILRFPILATPHFGANSRLQRNDKLRSWTRILLSAADGIPLLFEAQATDIDLPERTPKSAIKTFLPDASLVDRPLEVPKVGPLRLIHAGRLSAEKGSFRFVDLCSELDRRGVAFEAKIIGRADPATTRRMHAEVEQNGLGMRVSFIEWLDEPALVREMEAADVLVHLSSLDTFPLIVLEAMARGAYPIVLDLAGAREMVATYGGKIVSEPDAVEEAVNWLAAQDLPSLRAEAAAIGASVRADLHWQSVVQRLTTLFDLTLRTKRAQR